MSSALWVLIAVCLVVVEALAPGLTGGRPVLSRSVHADGLYEGQIAEGLGAIQARHPTLDIGSYPYYRPDRSGVALVAKGLEETEIVAAAAEMAALIREVGKLPVEGEPG